MRFPFSANPVLVKNPITGQHVNVGPLFEAINETSEGTKNATTQAMKETIDDAIRFLSTALDEETVAKNPGIVPRICSELYLIKDMLGAIKSL